MLKLSEANGSVTFGVRVAPRAARTEAAGEHDGALRVRVAAPPVEGAANEELTRFLARALNVAPKDVETVGGHASKLKRVRVRGVELGRPLRLASGA